MLFRLCLSMTSATAITGSPSVRSASNPIAMASERKSPSELARALLLTKSAAAPATSPITTCASTLASAPPSKSMVSRSAGPAACSRNSAAFPPTPFTLLRKALARPSSQAPEKTEPLSLPLAPPRLAWFRSGCRPFAGAGQLPTFPHRSHDPARCVRIRAQHQVPRFVRGNLSQRTRQTHLACLMQLFHWLVKQVRIAPLAVLGKVRTSARASNRWVVARFAIANARDKPSLDRFSLREVPSDAGNNGAIGLRCPPARKPLALPHPLDAGCPQALPRRYARKS